MLLTVTADAHLAHISMYKCRFSHRAIDDIAYRMGYLSTFSYCISFGFSFTQFSPSTTTIHLFIVVKFLCHCFYLSGMQMNTNCQSFPPKNGNCFKQWAASQSYCLSFLMLYCVLRAHTCVHINKYKYIYTNIYIFILFYFLGDIFSISYSQRWHWYGSMQIKICQTTLISFVWDFNNGAWIQLFRYTFRCNSVIRDTFMKIRCDTVLVMVELTACLLACLLACLVIHVRVHQYVLSMYTYNIQISVKICLHFVWD